MKNTGQITRAMEAVSATKMRKAQQVALAARPYALAALDILERVSGKVETAHWLLERRPIKKIGLIILTSDKGLCGVLNNNILRAFERFARKNKEHFNNGQCEIITVGKFGANYLKRRGYNVVMEFEDMGDVTDINESEAISKLILDACRDKKYDAIFSVYTNFISTLSQEAVARSIFPLTMEDIRDFVDEIDLVYGNIKRDAESERFSYDYLLEPSPAEILDPLLQKLMEVKIYHMLLEANASEHSARMIAMKNASDNAKDLLNTLQLSFNKARQASITREIAEITGGAAALES